MTDIELRVEQEAERVVEDSPFTKLLDQKELEEAIQYASNIVISSRLVTA